MASPLTDEHGPPTHSGNKEAPGDAGASVGCSDLRSIPNRSATPVEAIDQRRADGLAQGLKVMVVVAGNPVAMTVSGKGDAVIERRPIFGLHEPARCRYAEDIQAVFKTAANSVNSPSIDAP